MEENRAERVESLFVTYMFLFYLCVFFFLLLFAFCIFLHGARLPFLQFAAAAPLTSRSDLSACLHSHGCANNHIDVTFYTVRNNKRASQERLFLSFPFFLPMSPN